ncbi:hypothetical protein ACWEWF_46800, partial [Streptomyces sp. NPDC003857]
RKHMASTSVSRIVPASGERVWDLIGGFHALPGWPPDAPRVARGDIERVAQGDRAGPPGDRATAAPGLGAPEHL